MKGAYLGTMNLASSGMTIGPIAGGFILERGGGKVLFLCVSLMLVLASVIYLLVQTSARKPNGVEVSTV